jgi:steroid delta-isomerase-like uncharacterized protein
MSTETNKVLARRVFDEVLNRRNLELLDELAAPDYIEHSPLPGQRTGIDGIRDRYTMLFNAFDCQFTVDDVIAEDNKVVLRWTQTGTHVGSLFGIPATNRSSRTTGIEIWRVENGKLAEHWDVVDVYGQLMQLGLIPQPAGSPA